GQDRTVVLLRHVAEAGGVVGIAEAGGDAQAGVLAGVAQGRIPQVLLTPGRLQREPAEGRGGVADGVGAAQRGTADGTAARERVPGLVAGAANDDEVALPVAPVGVGDHAGAAQVDGGETGGGGVDAANRDAAQVLVVQVPVGERQHDEGVVATLEGAVAGAGRL